MSRSALSRPVKIEVESSSEEEGDAEPLNGRSSPEDGEITPRKPRKNVFILCLRLFLLFDLNLFTGKPASPPNIVNNVATAITVDQQSSPVESNVPPRKPRKAILFYFFICDFQFNTKCI